MSNLIITIMCISLAVIVSTMGAMYVNTDVFKAKEYKHYAESGFVNLKVLYDMNVSYRKERPSVADWKNELNSISTKIQVPDSFKNGFDWSYGKLAGTRRYYFCFSGDYLEAAKEGFAGLRDGMDSEFILNSTCGATVNNFAMTSGSLAVTYWLQN